MTQRATDSSRVTQRDALLRAAERLFAQHGIDAVSLRAVMAAAGTNVAAVHYHFGTKDDLVEALVRTRSTELGLRREALLARLEGQERPDVRSLARAFVDPLVPFAEGPDTSWVRLVSTIAQTRHPALRLLDEVFSPQATRFGDLLRRARPELTLPTVRFRLAEAMTLTFRVLGDLDAVAANVAGPRGRAVTHEEVVGDLLDTVTAILAGPPDL